MAHILAARGRVVLGSFFFPGLKVVFRFGGKRQSAVTFCEEGLYHGKTDLNQRTRRNISVSVGGCDGRVLL